MTAAWPRSYPPDTKGAGFPGRVLILCSYLYGALSVTGAGAPPPLLPADGTTGQPSPVAPGPAALPLSSRADNCAPFSSRAL